MEIKNRGGSFDKIADQNSPFIFIGQTTPLTKLPPSLVLFCFLRQYDSAET